jgi:mono/diheme cytochrome c family protein
MNRLLLVLLLPAASIAADDKVERGAAVYRTTCAVAYCHGPEGKAGRAPGFIGRKLEPMTVGMAVGMGIRNTSMPGFGRVLKEADLEAVVAYVLSLGGAGGTAVESAAAVRLPPEIERGRVLFFDPGRMGSCGYCHEVAGRGAAVSLALQELRTARLDLKSVNTPGVVTARPAGEEAFPAVVAERSAARVRVYDLSARLPVRRTFTPRELAVEDGARWQHSTATDLYNAAELASIERYLKWMAAR